MHERNCSCLHTVPEEMVRWLLCVFLFFFQAEDGIRDLTVTGVQTCALPISARLPAATPCNAPRRGADGTPPCRRRTPVRPTRVPQAGCRAPAARSIPRATREIGRASCRERV